tara:strand:- start:1223 stop:1720 length:498 start_codon:yes stop_codon:yes gene_type:complete
MSKSRDIADSAATINYIDTLTSAAQSQINTANVNIATKAPLSNPTFTGTTTLVGVDEAYNIVTSTTNATTVDLDTGTNFSHTLTEATTFTFSNPAASGSVSSFTLKIVQDASASGFTVTWPAAVDWAAATAPTLTATASAVDYFVFITHDGGTTYYGFTAGQAMG